MSGVPRVSCAWEQTQLGTPTQPVRGSIKWKKHCNLMLYLQRTKIFAFAFAENLSIIVSNSWYDLNVPHILT